MATPRKKAPQAAQAAPQAAPQASQASQAAPSVEELLAAIVAASVKTESHRSQPKAAKDPWAKLQKPLTDKELAAVEKLREASIAADAKGWQFYADSTSFYSPKRDAEVKHPEPINLAKSTEKSRQGFLFNACVYATLQTHGQVWYGDVARLMVFFGITVKSAPLVCTRFVAITGAPVRWKDGWLQVDPMFKLPAMPNQQLYVQLSAATLAR